MKDKTNDAMIQRYYSPCGDLMLGSLEDALVFVTGRLKVIGIS